MMTLLRCVSVTPERTLTPLKKPPLSESASLSMSVVTNPVTVRSSSAEMVTPLWIVIVLLLLAKA